MALLHDATLTPGKRELMKGWLPGRPWFDGDLDRKPVGSFRFDDPAGEVGVECFLLGGEGLSTLLIPMTYRAAPVAGAEEHLIGTTEHSVLGKRWVYDGCADPVAVSALLTAIATGGHEATLAMEKDGETVVFAPTCRVVGSGSAAEPVQATSVDVVDDGDPTVTRAVTRAGDSELVVARVIGASLSGAETLTAQWGDHEPVVVAVLR